MEKDKILSLLDDFEYGDGTYESRLPLLDEVRELVRNLK